MELINILMVDDFQDNIDYWQSCFDKDQYSFLSANDVESVWKLFKRGVIPDLILLDMQIPFINDQKHETSAKIGLSLLRELNQQYNYIPVIIVSGHGDGFHVIEALKAGAFDFIDKPIDETRLRVSVANAVKVRLMAEKLNDSRFKNEKDPIYIGKSTAFRQMMMKINAIASEEAHVLITGETGAGKDIVARLLHSSSNRKGKPFNVINCPPNDSQLFDGELFGHKKGAFTGANEDRKGIFEQSNGGVLFLDEICNLSMENQAKFLRILEDNKVRRLGDNIDQDINVRVFAASNKHLGEMINEGKFRKDLYFRLAHYTVEVPSLHERQDDIFPLAKFFLDQISKRPGKIPRKLADESKEILENYHWSHNNVRQLLIAMERLSMASFSPEISANEVKILLLSMESEMGILESDKSKPIADFDDHLDIHEYSLDELLLKTEKKYIMRVLEYHKGNKTEAAKTLGRNRSYLYERMKLLGIPLINQK